MRNLPNYLKVFRFDHWIKNVFMLIGAILSIVFNSIPFSLQMCVCLVTAFLLSCFISSVNYVVNEILDSPHDKLHPTKHTRPIPSGRIKIHKLVFLAASLLVFSFSVSLWYFNLYFNGFLFLLFLAALMYNVQPLRLKDVPYMDVVSESVNNPIRLLIGWFFFSQTYEYPPVSLIFLFWVFGAFLMTAKRFAEIKILGHHQAIPYRKTYKYYSEKSLFFVLIAYAIITVILFVVLCIGYKQKVLFVLPLFIVFMIWFIKLAHDEESIVIEPEHVFRKPLFFLYCIVLCVSTLAIAFI